MCTKLTLLASRLTQLVYPAQVILRIKLSLKTASSLVFLRRQKSSFRLLSSDGLGNSVHPRILKECFMENINIRDYKPSRAEPAASAGKQLWLGISDL